MADRKIIVNDQTWTWRAGRTFVKIRDPKGKGYVRACSDVRGFKDGETFSRGQWKRTSDGMITPEHIRKFILSLLENKTHG